MALRLHRFVANRRVFSFSRIARSKPCTISTGSHATTIQTRSLVIPTNDPKSILATHDKQMQSLFSQLNEMKKTHPMVPKLKEILDDFQKGIHGHKKFVQAIPKSNPNDIFANGEISFDNVDVFGFDYDYTLASYTDRVQEFIYTNALKWMVDHLKYPSELQSFCKFDPKFAIRGLHFDIKKGNLLKLDFLGHLQPDAVYYGRRQLTVEQCFQQYPSLFVQRQQHEQVMRSLTDIYCLPEACLISDIIQYFVEHSIAFDPSYVFEDVMKAKDYVHAGIIHKDIVNNLPLYLNKHPGLAQFLLKLREAGKKIFLLTNSNFQFVDKGMRYLLSGLLPQGVNDWTEMFDIVMTSSHKPGWFTRTRPFRILEPATSKVKWERLKELRPGEIYVEGSLQEFKRLTQWRGARVLYFGDHIFNDLIEPNSIEGWKTGVIIRELETEVKIQNSPEYRALLAELLELEEVIGEAMYFEGEGSKLVVKTLKSHRNQIRSGLKIMFSETFGSVFRTHRSDVYTSKIENFLEYPMHYVFYPERAFLPHEAKIPTRGHVVSLI